MPASRVRVALLLLPALLPLMLAAAPESQPAKPEPLSYGEPVRRQFYALTLNGKRVGRALEKVVKLKDPNGNEVFHSFTGTVLEISRGDTTIAMVSATTTAETAAGKPLWFDYRQQFGNVTVKKVGTFEDTKDGQVVKLAISQGGTTLPEKTIAVDPKALPSQALQRWVLAQKLAVGTVLNVVQIAPEMEGTLFCPMEVTIVGEGEKPLMGQPVPAWHTESRLKVPGMGNVMADGWFDKHFERITETTDLGGLKIIAAACTEQQAKAPSEQLEMMGSTLVHPKGPRIANARSADTGRYILRLKQPVRELPTLPTTGMQAVNALPASGGWEIVLKRRPAQLPDSKNDLPKAELDKYLTASSMVNHADPNIQALVKGWRGDSKDALTIAGNLRDGVRKTITSKNLDVGYATASEVAITKTGDCTEHAVLLVAALRACGIPARGVTGLVYADQFLGNEAIFGYHMWAQAFINGQWVDLDAALPGQERVDATHIALSTPSLNDDASVGEMAAILPILNNLEIEIVAPQGK